MLFCVAFRFLRGGIEAEVLQIEEDTLQEHVHLHSLNDPGHEHTYSDYYEWQNNIDGNDGVYGDDADIPTDHTRTTQSAKAGISITIDGVSGARTSTETRPKNMRVVYIMKVC